MDATQEEVIVCGIVSASREPLLRQEEGDVDLRAVTCSVLDGVRDHLRDLDMPLIGEAEQATSEFAIISPLEPLSDVTLGTPGKRDVRLRVHRAYLPSGRGGARRESSVGRQ